MQATGSGRIIISHDHTVSPGEAVAGVLAVMRQGKISESAGILHYCWITVLTDGRHVQAHRKGHYEAADSFHAWKQNT